jgi:Holliday junction DNA helicase RuvB
LTDNPLSPQRQPEDADAALRPKSLGEFVGQEAVLGTAHERTYT